MNKFINKVFVTNNSKETKKLGFNFAKELKKGNVVCLYGELGSGKTTFVQGLAEGLGVKDKIISPTFIIVRNYRIKNQESRIKNFYHIDLYRTESDNDLIGLGLEEILESPSNIVVVEWAEKMGNLLPEKRIDIKFSYRNENARDIAFSLTT